MKHDLRNALPANEIRQRWKCVYAADENSDRDTDGILDAKLGTTAVGRVGFCIQPTMLTWRCCLSFAVVVPPHI